MELVAVLRVLWQRRRSLAVALVLCTLVAGMAARGGTPPLEIAWARLVLDTDDSQFLKADPAGADSLTWRGELLAVGMTGDAMRERVARAAGLQPDQLRIIEPRLLVPEVETALPKAATGAAALVYEPYTVTVEYNDSLPVLTLEARGKDAAVTERLVEATTEQLAAQGVERGTEQLQGFVVDRVTPIVMRTQAGKGPVAKAIAIGFVLSLLAACAIAIAPSRRRVRRIVGRLRAA